MKNIALARSLPWNEVASLIEHQLAVILHRTAVCHAWPEDYSYWAVTTYGQKFSISELLQLMKAVDTSPDLCLDTIPEDSDVTSSISNSLSSLLLKRELQAEWKQEYPAQDRLWLLDYHGKESALQNENLLWLPGISVPVSELKTKRELIEYLSQNGATHAALMDFCEEYRDRFENELYWPYPISDGMHLGTFLVPVREGILSLPYDDADRVDYESFRLEDVKMFDVKSMEDFICDWELFSKELLSVMYSMKRYLEGRQEIDES